MKVTLAQHRKQEIVFMFHDCSHHQVNIDYNNTVCCMLYAVCCMLYAVYCMLYAVCCIKPIMTKNSCIIDSVCQILDIIYSQAEQMAQRVNPAVAVYIFHLIYFEGGVLLCPFSFNPVSIYSTTTH